MSGLNRVTLIGRLGRNPEVRRTQNGNLVVSFSLAVTETWRDKHTGEKRDKTEWVNIVIWNEALGKVAENYLRKGSNVYLSGKLRTREFDDRNGDKRRMTEVVLENFGGEIVLIDSKPRANDEEDRSDAREETAPHKSSGSLARELDDDIPF